MDDLVKAGLVKRPLDPADWPTRRAGTPSVQAGSDR
jgi:hypothetical protein